MTGPNDLFVRYHQPVQPVGSHIRQFVFKTAEVVVRARDLCLRRIKDNIEFQAYSAGVDFMTGLYRLHDTGSRLAVAQECPEMMALILLYKQNLQTGYVFKAF